jgi:hypothetical protein
MRREGYDGLDPAPAAGWVASTPAWPAHGLPRSTGITDFNNVTSMPYAGVSGGYG